MNAVSFSEEFTRGGDGTEQDSLTVRLCVQVSRFLMVHLTYMKSHLPQSDAGAHPLVKESWCVSGICDGSCLRGQLRPRGLLPEGAALVETFIASGGHDLGPRENTRPMTFYEMEVSSQA